MERSDRFWNPYVAGIALGLVLLASFLVMGKGLGASGAANRLGVAIATAVAPHHVAANPNLAATKGDRDSVLDDWLVFEILGVFLGGAIGAYTAGRLGTFVIRGPRIGVPARLTFAFAGGLLMGMAARAARGCTSGQALSGGAVLSVGAWIFMLSVFAGGYAFAWFVRRQWS
ncbi:MAG TPA: YeeE/YedE thiosulfate transporter family protein [Thermoanaerobaculia bacterium]|nr:YeeE/YedE thiosulfate transporter family protein [Thermoanaerobaculia bacterium]